MLPIINNFSNWVSTQLSQRTPEVLQNNPLLSYYIQGMILSFVIYLFYLELSPGMGAIFIRPDENGQSRFRLRGIVPFLKHPFKNLDFWKPNNWDLNFIVFTGTGAAIYTGLKYYLNHMVPT